jgi:hypothetical protein
MFKCHFSDAEKHGLIEIVPGLPSGRPGLRAAEFFGGFFICKRARKASAKSKQSLQLNA